MKDVVKGAVVVIGLLLAAWCAWAAVTHGLKWRKAGYEACYVASWRDAAGHARGGDVGVLCSDAQHLSPVDRSRLIAVNWELGTRPARPVATEEISGTPAALVVSKSPGKKVERELDAAGYERVFCNEMAALWCRSATAVRAGTSSGEACPWGALLGAAGVAVLMAFGLLAASSCRLRLDWRLLLAVAVFAVLTSSVLSHRLLAPNGLGVYAGKARLFLEAGGIPAGFWSDPAYAPYQPSYPPGLTALAWLAFALGGGWSDVFVQLLSPAAMAVLFCLLTKDTRSWLQTVAALAVVLCPVAQTMTAGLYAEPFAAACLAAGLRRAEVRDGTSAWLLVGCAGLFRHEGLLVAGLTAIFLSGRARRWRATAAAVMPGLVWELAMHAVGAGPYDFDWTGGPSCARMVEAGLMALALAGTSACRIGCVVIWPVLAAADSFRSGGRVANGLPILSAVLAVLTGVVLLSCSVSGSYSTMVFANIPRFAWLAFIPALVRCGVHPKGAT